MTPSPLRRWGDWMLDAGYWMLDAGIGRNMVSGMRYRAFGIRHRAMGDGRLNTFVGIGKIMVISTQIRNLK
jgi:hypothetical protein